MRLNSTQPLAISLLSLTALIASSHAQSFQPRKTESATSVFIENKAMYILGGYLNRTEVGTSQTFSIDLSTSWNTQNPIYTQLPSMVTDFRIPSALIDDEIWYVISGGRGYEYNIATQFWQALALQPTITEYGTAAAYNPITRRVYIPNANKQTTTDPHSILIYEYSTKSYFYNTMPAALVDINSFSVAWASSIQSVLLFGGNVYGTWNTRNDLYSYHATDGWKNLVTNGAIPPARTLGCFVPAYSGTKMILFGGFTGQTDQAASGTAFGDIHILDVVTLTWTKGVDIPASVGGIYSQVCAFSNDQLIVWGGYSSKLANTQTFVYNLKTMTWTDNFVSLKESQSSPTATAGPKPSQGGQSGNTKPDGSSKDGQDGEDSKSLAPIIGGVVGGVVVIVAIVGFIFYRRKSKNATHQQPIHKPVAPLPQSPNMNPVEPQMHQVQQPMQVFQPVTQPQQMFQPQYQYQNQNQNQLPISFNTHPQPQVQYSAYYVPAEPAQVPYSMSPPAHVYQPPVLSDVVIPTTYQASPMQSDWSGNNLSLHTNASSPHASTSVTNPEPSTSPSAVNGPQLYHQNDQH
ncbi:hypothetical protein BGZ76_004939 [Entomortierella beljakovae]|nr:hypothetical protein BGZ76_004939 [Entomortierella beljakovae]